MVVGRLQTWLVCCQRRGGSKKHGALGLSQMRAQPTKLYAKTQIDKYRKTQLHQYTALPVPLPLPPPLASASRFCGRLSSVAESSMFWRDFLKRGLLCHGCLCLCLGPLHLSCHWLWLLVFDRFFSLPNTEMHKYTNTQIHKYNFYFCDFLKRF